jgi:hypothetical protein
VVGASCTLNISFKHTTGDYLDAEHPLKPLEKSLMKLQNFQDKNSEEFFLWYKLHPF